MKFPEIGYTPANLRALISASGLSQQAWADKYGYPLVRVQRWLLDLDKKSHRDMSAIEWRQVVDKLNKLCD